MQDYDLSQTDLDRERHGWYYEKPHTLSNEERKQQLEGWQASRRGEVSSVVWSFLLTVFTSCIVFVSVYGLCRHFFGEVYSVGVAAMLSIVPLVIRIAVWLQTWGSYIERRLEEIEAKIEGRSPVYYMQHDDGDFSKHTLYDRLERLEKIVDHIAVATTGEAYLRMRARL
ncbi:MAG TPA: hypothetical protein VIX42_11260 [Edaphobacter sp.]